MQMAFFSEILKTETEVVGMMGDKVSVNCQYDRSSGSMWFLIQWQRQMNGSGPVTIVTLPNNFMGEVRLSITRLQKVIIISQ